MTILTTVKKYRYLIAGAISLLIHGVALSFSSPKPEITLANDLQGQALNIQFISVAQVKKEATRQETENKPAPMEEAPQAIEKPLPQEVNKEVQPPKPKPVTKPKPVEKPQKVVQKKPEQKKITPKPVVPKPVQKPVTTAKKPIEPVKPEPKEVAKVAPAKTTQVVKENLDEKVKIDDVTVTEATETTTASESAKPKMIRKPTFSAKPTAVNYPKLAQRRGWQGNTLVEIWINEEGQQMKQLIVHSSGHEILDVAAVKAVTKWKFQRRNEQGQRMAYRVQVPINFKLN
ncbi:putative TonB protein [Vibrio halioticoli NBRC 102217]|uniref:Putative TonB protein n=1 Tax=Vibrio halioticoli NBRC 102217 TaxID=1219072 RepID=V5F0G1_9VIBR|nr:energy transducer TonB [Vibrio halioticoli]GAD88599.1 putative TonB protein [Vibrio halioticoli NBRC 102217]